MTGPLEGVVILDLTQQLAGPGGTMLRGDMGATRWVEAQAPAGSRRAGGAGPCVPMNGPRSGFLAHHMERAYSVMEAQENFL